MHRELKALLKTGKLTSTTLVALGKIPKNFVVFIKRFRTTGKVAIKKLSNNLSKIVVEGQEIARITKEKLIFAK